MLVLEPSLYYISGFWLNCRLQYFWLNSLKDAPMLCLSSSLLFFPAAAASTGFLSNFEAHLMRCPLGCLYPDWLECLCSLTQGASDPENDTKVSGTILHRAVMEGSLLVYWGFIFHMLINCRLGIINKGKSLTAAWEIHRVFRIQSTSKTLPCPWQLVTICNYSIM